MPALAQAEAAEPRPVLRRKPDPAGATPPVVPPAAPPAANPKGSPPLLTPPGGGKPVVRYKALRIDMIRRGDEHDLREREITLLDPAYEWVYR